MADEPEWTEVWKTLTDERLEELFACIELTFLGLRNSIIR
jgi:hypothetical protein